MRVYITLLLILNALYNISFQIITHQIITLDADLDYNISKLSETLF